MLSSFSSTSTSSTSSPYENPSSWWKFNLTGASCASLATALLPTNQTIERKSLTDEIDEKSKQRSNNRYYQSSQTNGSFQHEQNGEEKTLRILIFAESFPSFTSGITRRFKEIIRRLAKHRHQIHVITGCTNATSWTEGNENLEDFVSFSILPSTEFSNKIDCACPFLFPNPSIYGSIRRFKPDVVHVVEQTPAAMLCGAFAKSLDIPIVWSSHTNIDFYLSTYIRRSAVGLTQRIYQFVRLTHLNYSSINLTVSRDFAVFMEKTGVPRPVTVWKTGVDSDLFNPSRRSRSMRYRMFGNDHSFTEEQMDQMTLFLCVGRISPEKNFEFLSLVLNRIGNQTFLCIVGDGPYRNSLEPIFPKDRVFFLGYLGGEELASAYASADYFIYASVSETFGQVYLEAMASGTPVVAAEGGQLKEFFVNGKHGFLWKPDDLDSAERSIRSAMRNREYLSDQARKQALKHSWDSAGEQLNEIYFDAIKQKQSRPKKTSWYSPLFHVGRLVFYVFNWLICILMALFLMAPFVRVTPPTSTIAAKQHRFTNGKLNPNVNHYRTSMS